MNCLGNCSLCNLLYTLLNQSFIHSTNTEEFLAITTSNLRGSLSAAKMSWSFVLQWFRPCYDATFSTLPFSLRWRLLVLQALTPVTYSIGFLPWTFSRRYTVHYIPTRAGRSVRAIVFKPPVRENVSGLRPLHLDVHGGGFLGGIPESEANFLALLSDQMGAVVVSTDYRYPPQAPVPSGH